MKVLGIDIGGSAFKGAPVDTEVGKLLNERLRIETQPFCQLKDGAAAVHYIAKHFKWKGPIGIGFPGVIRKGHIGAVGNLGDHWVGQNGQALFSEATGCKVRLINDAAAAGRAEMAFGAGRGRKDAVLMLTFGTGIGSSLFFGGVQYPRAEFGHISWEGKAIERFAAAVVKTDKNLTWKQWAVRVNIYLKIMERLLSPDLIIVGGGVSKKSDKWLRYLKADAEVVPAKLHNDAGIIGSALAD